MNADFNLYAVFYVLVGILAGFTVSWLSIRPYARIAAAREQWYRGEIHMRSFLTAGALIALYAVGIGAVAVYVGFFALLGILVGLYTGAEAGSVLIAREMKSLANSLT